MIHLAELILKYRKKWSWPSTSYEVEHPSSHPSVWHRQTCRHKQASGCNLQHNGFEKSSWRTQSSVRDDAHEKQQEVGWTHRGGGSDSTAPRKGNIVQWQNVFGTGKLILRRKKKHVLPILNKSKHQTKAHANWPLICPSTDIQYVGILHL